MCHTKRALDFGQMHAALITIWPPRLFIAQTYLTLRRCSVWKAIYITPYKKLHRKSIDTTTLCTSGGPVLVGSTACFPIEIAGESDTENPKLLLPI